jgi:hypothetical protein
VKFCDQGDSVTSPQERLRRRMGKKRLKAVAIVKGTQPLRAADPG